MALFDLVLDFEQQVEQVRDQLPWAEVGGRWGVPGLRCLHLISLQFYLFPYCSSVTFTLCNPLDYSPPGSSVHGILQARILECVAISFSRGSSQPRMEPVSPASPALAGRFFTTVPLVKIVHLRSESTASRLMVKPAVLSLVISIAYAYWVAAALLPRCLQVATSYCCVLFFNFRDSFLVSYSENLET